MRKVVKGYFAQNQVRNVPQSTPYRFSALRSRKIPHFRIIHCGAICWRLDLACI